MSIGLVLKVAHNCFTKYTTQYDAMESTASGAHSVSEE